MNIKIIYKTKYNFDIFISRGDFVAKSTIRIERKGDDGYKVISVRIKDGVLQKIDDLAKESNRSRNEVINILLENCVDDVEIN